MAEKGRLSGQDAARGFRNRPGFGATPQSRGFRNRPLASCGPLSSWFQEPVVSWFREPQGHRAGEPPLAWYQEPRSTWFSEPIFVVSGTLWRGNRNQRLQKYVHCQWVNWLSTALNCLTSLYNRVSFNGGEGENTKGKRRLLGATPPPARFAASRLRPGRFAPSHPASPRWCRATPHQSFLSEEVPRFADHRNDLSSRRRRYGLFGKSLAFLAVNPRNREWAASGNEGASR